MTFSKFFVWVAIGGMLITSPIGSGRASAAACPGTGIVDGDIIADEATGVGEDRNEVGDVLESPALFVPGSALNFVDTSKNVGASPNVSFGRLGKITGSDGKSYHLFYNAFDYLLNDGSPATNYGFVEPNDPLYTRTMPRKDFLRLVERREESAGPYAFGTYNPVVLAMIRGGVKLAGGSTPVGWGVAAIVAGVNAIQNVPISAYEIGVITKNIYGYILIVPDAALSGTQEEIGAQLKLMQVYRDYEAVEPESGQDVLHEAILSYLSPTQAGNMVGYKFGAPDNPNVRAAACDITISTEVTTQLKTAYASGEWKGSDVSAAAAISGTSNDPDQYGVCGKPSLKNILNFAFCNLLDSIISFLKSLL